MIFKNNHTRPAMESQNSKRRKGLSTQPSKVPDKLLDDIERIKVLICDDCRTNWNTIINGTTANMLDNIFAVIDNTLELCGICSKDSAIVSQLQDLENDLTEC